MKRRICRHLIIIILIMLINNRLIFAEPLKDLKSENLAISLVIDTSGSMLYTDPHVLRGKVADIFIDLLNPDDYLGIITFNSDVDLAIPMEQLTSDELRQSFKEELKPKLEGIGKTGKTDYNLALKKANEQLEELEDDSLNKIIIFLTDGKPNPEDIGKDVDKMNTYMDELWDIVEKISKNNYPVYSIGFSEEIDVEILNRIVEETHGDLRIYKDVNSLDAGLIQTLESRETIVDNLLLAVNRDTIDILPSLNTDFWLRDEGYRLGEETVISSYLTLAGRRVETGPDLIIESYDLIIDYEDGDKFTLPLYDNDSTRENGSIWSNKLIFDKEGKAEANLVVTGRLKNQPFKLEKIIGEYKVSQVGSILVEAHESNLQSKSGGRLRIPIRFNNESNFKERVLVKVDDGIGILSKKYIDLEPNWSGDVDLYLNLNKDQKNKVYQVEIEFETLNENTSLNKEKLIYNIEVISKLQDLKNRMAENNLVLMLAISVFLGIPLIIYILGMILYLLIVKPRINLQGKLLYWKDDNPGMVNEFNLNKKKRNRLTISMGSDKEVDLNILESRYKYDLVITNHLLKKSYKFILGWLMILSRDPLLSLEISTTQPGIIIYNDDIHTKLDLYNGMEFTSGEYNFQYQDLKAKARASEDRGKDVLEGRV